MKRWQCQLSRDRLLSGGLNEPEQLSKEKDLGSGLESGQKAKADGKKGQWQHSS